jgi:3-oxoacyl-[acyl-carrier protein] reductase
VNSKVSRDTKSRQTFGYVDTVKNNLREMVMNMTLSGKVALVTGGGGGIGSEICRSLAKAGARVVITHKDPSGLEKSEATLQSLEGEGHLVALASVVSSQDLRALAETITEKYGKLDILVNCAGLTRFVAHDDLEGLDDDLIDLIFKVNWRGSFATIRALEGLLTKSEDGLVVNISSIAGQTAMGSNVAYCASKAAINSMTMSLARSLSPNIRVLALSPGLVEGDYTKKLDPVWTKEQEQLTPLKRLTSAGDVADAVIACATLLKYSTGCVIPVDGGRPLT